MFSSTFSPNWGTHKSHWKEKNLPYHPTTSYSQTCRRQVNKLDISTTRSDDDYKDIIIAIYSSGIKVTNRGQWMQQDKWNNKKKKCYIKIHIAIDINTKEILALDVTDEKMHDGKVMPRLIDHILKNNNNIIIKSALGDGSYDSNENFKYFQEKRTKPTAIKVRKNSIISSKNNNRLRNKEVSSQIKDLFIWKKKRRIYGHRWMIETGFSSIKRMFGGYTSATKLQNMVKEMILKVSLYNLFGRLA